MKRLRNKKCRYWLYDVATHKGVVEKSDDGLRCITKDNIDIKLHSSTYVEGLKEISYAQALFYLYLDEVPR